MKEWTIREESFLIDQLNIITLTYKEIIDNFIEEFKDERIRRSRRGIEEKIKGLLKDNPEIYKLRKNTTPKNNLGGNTNPMSTTSSTSNLFNNSQPNNGDLPYMKQNNHSYINKMIEKESNNIKLKKGTTRHQTGNGNTSLGYPMSRTYTSNPFNNSLFNSNNDSQQYMNQGNSQNNYDSDINNMVKKLPNPKRKRNPKNNQTGHINSMLNTITNNQFNISQYNNNGKLPKKHKGTTNTMSSQTNTTRNRTDNKKNNTQPFNNTLPPYNNTPSYKNSSLPYMVQQQPSLNINDLIGIANYKNGNNNENGNNNDNMVLRYSDPVNHLGNINYNKSSTP